MQLPLIDIAVLIAYLLGVVVFGSLFAMKNRSSQTFMSAGGKLPAWVVGLSIFGTFVSSISFLANPGTSYARNWNPFVWSLSVPIAAWAAVKWFVPFYRRHGSISAYEHLEHRFGAWARTYAVLCYLLTQMARMGTIMYLVALALSPLLGWDIRLIILVTGVSVTIYTMLGGIEAVIWTDVVQSLVLIVGALSCVAILLFGMPEGPGQLFKIAAADAKFSLGSFSMSLAEPTFWVMLIYGLTINLQNYGIDQSYVQRYMTAESPAAAARSVWLSAGLFVPISAVFFFIGTGLFAFYKAHPGLLPPDIKPDAVFPFFIVHEVPVGLTGLIIAAVFAAAQSTLSTSLNSSATLVLCDIYKRYFRPRATERESMRVLHITSLVAGALGTGAALAMMHVKSALDAWWEMAGIFGGGMLGLFLLGFISRRATNAAALTGVIIGVLVIIWMTLSPRLTGDLALFASPFHNYMTIVIGTLTILLVGLAVTALRPGTQQLKQ